MITMFLITTPDDQVVQYKIPVRTTDELKRLFQSKGKNISLLDDQNSVVAVKDFRWNENLADNSLERHVLLWMNDVGIETVMVSANEGADFSTDFIYTKNQRQIYFDYPDCVEDEVSEYAESMGISDFYTDIFENGFDVATVSMIAFNNILRRFVFEAGLEDL